MMIWEKCFVKDANWTCRIFIRIRQLYVQVTLKGGQGLIVDFSAQQTIFVLEGMITQTILPCNDFTREIKKGDEFMVSFEGMVLSDYLLKVEKVSITGLRKVSNDDVFKNGFLYKPAFFEFMKHKGVFEEDTVVKLDFKLKGLVG